MLILNKVKTLKSSNFVILRNHFGSKINKNQDNVFHEKFKTNSKLSSKYHECMKYGLSFDQIHTNEWILNLSISE